MPAPSRLRSRAGRPIWAGLLLAAGWLLAGCQPQTEPAEASAPPPVGHYEGSISPAGQPEIRAALDIRHPSPGHYEAELTVPTAPALSFVADSLLFDGHALRLVRPARPGQTLRLTLDGDFWRGFLALDSARSPALLLRRGTPTPSTYRVEELPRASGSAWRFAPADTSTPGPALALLPDAETAPTAAIWADALAREGFIVLLMPAADSASAATETTRLQTALHLLRGTAGADTARVGVWAVGARAATLAQALADADAPGPRPAFFIAQNGVLDPAGRAAFGALKRRKLPLLGLYGGALAAARAAAWQRTLGGRGSAARAYRTAGAGLLVPGSLGGSFAPGLPGQVVEWLRGQR